MKVDTNNPFMVQEWIRRGIAKAHKSIRDDFNSPHLALLKEEAEKSVASMERSLLSLNGIGTLHINQMYEKALGKISWWKFADRRDFRNREDEWKAETRERLINESAAAETLEL